MAIFGRFSESAQRAMSGAQQEAREMKQNLVSSEHMLLALLKNPAQMPREITGKADYSQVREMIRSAERETSMLDGAPRMELSPRMQKVIELAILESRRMAMPYVTAGHLLLGILREGDSTAANILRRLGVDYAKAREEMEQQIRREQQEQNRRQQQENGGNGASQEGALAQYSRDLTEAARKGELDPVIGHDREIQRIIQILIRRTKNNPVLIGEPGVGKSAVVEGLAQRIAAGNIPEMLAGKRLLSLDISGLVAGSKFRGEFEERLKNVMNEVKRAGDALIFIDEIHTIVGAGQAEGSLDAANILKPALARGELQCIGATTLDEYRKHIEKDAALERRFQPVMVGEPTVEEALEILHGLRDRYEQHHQVHITDEALKAAVTLSDRYISDRFLPDKAIDLMDEAASRVRIEAFTAPPDLKEQQQRLEAVQAEKKDAIDHQDFEKAASLRDQERCLKQEIESLRENWGRSKSGGKDNVTEEDIAAIVAGWTGISVTKLTETEAERLLHLEDALHQRVVGQEEAVSAVSRAIRRARAGLKDPKRPIGSFIFLGPTGVGKTEVCRALGEAMFGDEDAVIRVDMSEYMEKHTVSRLVGSPPGYVGYEEGGQLTEAVRRKPYSVVLLDEVEKAHPDVFNILLQILEDGRLTDNTGRVVSFKNTIIVMTSNAGASTIGSARTLGFGATALAEVSGYEAMKESGMKEVKNIFRPEFINRVDELIVFHSLTEEDIGKIAEMMLRQVTDRLKEREITLTWTDEALRELVREGYDPKYGARPLRRVIQRTVEDTLSEELIAGTVRLGDTAILDTEGGRLTVRLAERGAAEQSAAGEPAPEETPA